MVTARSQVGKGQTVFAIASLNGILWQLPMSEYKAELPFFDELKQNMLTPRPYTCQLRFGNSWIRLVRPAEQSSHATKTFITRDELVAKQRIILGIIHVKVQQADTISLWLHSASASVNVGLRVSTRKENIYAKCELVAKQRIMERRCFRFSLDSHTFCKNSHFAFQKSVEWVVLSPNAHIELKQLN